MFHPRCDIFEVSHFLSLYEGGTPPLLTGEGCHTFLLTVKILRGGAGNRSNLAVFGCLEETLPAATSPLSESPIFLHQTFVTLAALSQRFVPYLSLPFPPCCPTLPHCIAPHHLVTLPCLIVLPCTASSPHPASSHHPALLPCPA